MTRCQSVLFLGIVTLAVWTFLHSLGAGSLHDWDEATYGEIAREMVRRHDWMTPYWNESPFFNKPPLVMWLMGLGLGVPVSEELAVRLPSALAGLTAVALTGWLGMRMFEWTTGATAALLLVIGSASQRTFLGLARHGMLDAPLTATMVWVMLHFWVGLRDHRHWLLLGLPLGIGFMVRGPVHGAAGRGRRARGRAAASHRRRRHAAALASTRRCPPSCGARSSALAPHRVGKVRPSIPA